MYVTRKGERDETYTYGGDADGGSVFKWTPAFICDIQLIRDRNLDSSECVSRFETDRS